MIDIMPGDKMEILQRDWHGQQGEGVRWERYEVLQIFPHHVLCRNVRGGYRECFTRYQLRRGKRTERAERMRIGERRKRA